MSKESKRNLYKDSGVDVEKGDALVDWLREDSTSSRGRLGEVVSGIGGFAALFRPNFKGMTDPLLVSGTDGVGTKVLLGLEHGLLQGLGIDLVAMCVNDLYTIGAAPLFFLDYYATGTLDDRQFKEVLTGIKKGLAQSNALLLGGETAELPGLYAKGHFDLAGFVVGVVDEPKRLGPHLVKPGDKLIAFESSGFHSNGYSLLRKWVADRPVPREVVERLMEPTRIYGEIPELLSRLDHGKIHALANITGGGISGNLPRVMPRDVTCEIYKGNIPTPYWMSEFLQENGASFEEVEGVFNLGAGMIAAVAADSLDEVTSRATELGIGCAVIGDVHVGKGEPTVVFR